MCGASLIRLASRTRRVRAASRKNERPGRWPGRWRLRGPLRANEAKRETAGEEQQTDQPDKRKRTCGGGQRVVGAGRCRCLAASGAYGARIRGCAAGEAGSLIIARIRGDCRHLL